MNVLLASIACGKVTIKIRAPIQKRGKYWEYEEGDATCS